MYIFDFILNVYSDEKFFLVSNYQKIKKFLKTSKNGQK